MEPLPISSGQTYRPLAHRNMNVVLLMNNIVTLAPQPRTQARSSRVESDWDFGLALGVMGKTKRKRAWPITISKWQKVTMRN